MYDIQTKHDFNEKVVIGRLTALLIFTTRGRRGKEK